MRYASPSRTTHGPRVGLAVRMRGAMQSTSWRAPAHAVDGLGVPDVVDRLGPAARRVPAGDEPYHMRHTVRPRAARTGCWCRAARPRLRSTIGDRRRTRERSRRRRAHREPDLGLVGRSIPVVSSRCSRGTCSPSARRCTTASRRCRRTRRARRGRAPAGRGRRRRSTDASGSVSMNPERLRFSRVARSRSTPAAGRLASRQRDRNLRRGGWPSTARWPSTSKIWPRLTQCTALSPPTCARCCGSGRERKPAGSVSSAL